MWLSFFDTLAVRGVEAAMLSLIILMALVTVSLVAYLVVPLVLDLYEWLKRMMMKLFRHKT